MEKNNTNFKSICIAILISFGLMFLQSFVMLIAKKALSNDALIYTFSYIPFIIIVSIIYRKKLINDLKNLKKDLKGNITKIAIFTCIFILLEILTNFIIYLITKSLSSNESEARKLLFNNIPLMIINIIILAPITEEFIYRLPYKQVKYYKIVNYIIYSLVFAIAHLSFVNGAIDLLYLIPYFFLSLAIGYGFYKTDNIFVSIIIHIANNVLSIMLLLL